MLATTLLAAAPFALGVLAQIQSMPNGTASGNNSIPAATTLALFLDAEPDQGFAGSIVAADGCETTIAMYCTEGDYGFGQLSGTCDGRTADTLTFRGSTEFGLSTEVETETYGYDANVIVTESCSLEPSSRAVCSVSIKAKVEDNGKTKTMSTITYEGAEASNKWFQVPITGGAEKLPAATAVCQVNGNAAASGGRGVAEVWKVVVVPGAAALLAGAAIF